MSLANLLARRAALYLRQSKDAEEGIDRQRTRTTALVTARGWLNAGEYVDNDTSASTKRGPGTAWHRLLQDAKAGKIDVLVSVDLDRFARSTKDLNTLIDLGLAVTTVDGEIDLATADGEFRATMLAAIARFEVRRKAERQIRANEQRASKGIAHSAPRLKGFPGAGISAEQLERERATVRALFAGFDRGETIVGLSRAHDIGPSSVRKLLLNQRFAGRRTYQGEYVAPGDWEAIVDPDLFDRVGVRLSHPGRRMNKMGTALRLLGTGLYRCAGCSEGVASNGRISSGGGEGSHYRCRDCGMTRSSVPIDAFVEEVLLARLRMPDMLAAMMPSRDVSALVAESATITMRLDGLAQLVADGTLTADGVRAAAEPLRSRLTAVHSEIAAASVPPVLEGLEGRVVELWPTLALSVRRRILDAFMTVTLSRAPKGRREFDPASVVIEWKHAA